MITFTLPWIIFMSSVDVLAYIQKKKKIFGNLVSAAAPVKSHVRFKIVYLFCCYKFNYFTMFIIAL